MQGSSRVGLPYVPSDSQEESLFLVRIVGWQEIWADGALGMRRTSGTVAVQTMNMCLFPVRPKIVCFAILLCRNNERRRCFSRSSGRHEATTTTRRLLLLLGILKFANHNGQSLNCSDNQGRAALVIAPLGFSVFGQIVTENNGIRAFNGGRQLSPDGAHLPALS